MSKQPLLDGVKIPTNILETLVNCANNYLDSLQNAIDAGVANEDTRSFLNEGTEAVEYAEELLPELEDVDTGIMAAVLVKEVIAYEKHIIFIKDTSNEEVIELFKAGKFMITEAEPFDLDVEVTDFELLINDKVIWSVEDEEKE